MSLYHVINSTCFCFFFHVLAVMNISKKRNTRYKQAIQLDNECADGAVIGGGPNQYFIVEIIIITMVEQINNTLCTLRREHTLITYQKRHNLPPIFKLQVLVQVSWYAPWLIVPWPPLHLSESITHKERILPRKMTDSGVHLYEEYNRCEYTIDFV